MGRRRQKPTGEDIPAGAGESLPQGDCVRDDRGGRSDDGVHVQADVSQAPKPRRSPKAGAKSRRSANNRAEVKPPVELQEPFKSAGCNCSTCPFAKDGKPHQFVLPTPHPSPKGVVVLGSGPTWSDLKAGEAMTGPVAKEMEEVLAEAGITRRELLFVNAWACRGPEPRKASAETKAALACAPLLRSTLATLPPETPVLVCGALADVALTGRRKGFAALRGFVDAHYRIGQLAGAAEQVPEVEPPETEE